jgi:tetratricopeptide (TPR) repeat protein
MIFFLTDIVALALAIFILWWLSGFDAQVTGENKKADLFRRLARCGLTLILATILFGAPSVLAIIIIPASLGVLWCGCIAELLARGFRKLIDPEDERAFDPAKSLRELDTIAGLIKNGRREEAIQLCEALKETGDVSILTLEMTLELLGVRQENVRKPKPLVEAYRLRLQGKFNEAEIILNSLLFENPANVDAAMMLMRLYAQDLRRSDKAVEILRSLEKQPYVSADYVGFARRSIAEWANPKREKTAVEPMPESIDELLAQKYFGTAIEMLEQKIKEQPENFDSWMKLAEAHGRHCDNLELAGKIVRQIETNPAFDKEQIQFAKMKLDEWREARLKHD